MLTVQDMMTNDEILAAVKAQFGEDAVNQYFTSIFSVKVALDHLSKQTKEYNLTVLHYITVLLNPEIALAKATEKIVREDRFLSQISKLSNDQLEKLMKGVLKNTHFVKKREPKETKEEVAPVANPLV